MSKCGEILQDSGNDRLTGRIQTLKFRTSFELVRLTDRGNSPDAPAYEINVKAADGGFVSIGNAWEKEIQRGDQAGKTMLSLSFDDPSFEKPLHVSAFPTDRGGPNGEYVFDMVWRRPRPGAGSNAGSGVPGDLGDEIPF